MDSLKTLGDEINKIKLRNKRVESDKAWEASWTRRVSIIVFTYLAIGLYLQAINVNNPWLNAIVPSVGFMLSTLTLPALKKLWQKYIYKRKENE